MDETRRNESGRVAVSGAGNNIISCNENGQLKFVELMDAYIKTAKTGPKCNEHTLRCRMNRLSPISFPNYSNVEVLSNATYLHGNMRRYELICKNFPKTSMQDLAELFSNFGEVYQIGKHFDHRLIYVSNYCAEHAEKVIATLSNRWCIKQRLVLVEKQNPRDELIIRNVPMAFTRSDIFELLSPHTPNLTNVTVYNNPKNVSWNRGFAYLRYTDHYEANEAMASLNKKKLFRRLVHKVELADKSKEWLPSNTTIYIINASLPKQNIVQIFEQFGQLYKEGIRQSGNFRV